MKLLFRWFHKLVLGWTVGLYFLPKIRYENRKKRPHGPCIIISNHKNQMDFLLMLWVFYFRYLRCLVGKTFYECNGLITFLLKMLGAIKVDRFSFDMDFFYECMDALKKKQSLLIFPEGRFSTTGELFEFRDTATLLALQAGVPVVPVYHTTNYGLFRRVRVRVGEPIDLSSLCDTANPDPQELKRLTAVLREKILVLKEQTEQ